MLASEHERVVFFTSSREGAMFTAQERVFTVTHYFTLPPIPFFVTGLVHV